MLAQRNSENELICGLISISDRASRGEYVDEGIPALEAWLHDAIITPVQFHTRLIADDRYTIEETIRELVDRVGCDLVFTTGGTGPSRRDVTPEATLAVGTRELPGFAEQMRRISLNFVPTAILSRQVAVLRETPTHAALIVNLPGRPKSISETLGGFRSDDGEVIDAGIFASIPYCIDLIGGPYIETNPEIIAAFRPKNAVRKHVSEQPAKPQEPASAPSQEQAQPAQRILRQAPTRIVTPETHANPNNAASFAAAFAQPQQQPQQVQQPRVQKILRPHSTDTNAKPAMSPEMIARRSVQHGIPLFATRTRTAPEPLEVIVRDPEDGSTPECTVIWLHGLGADDQDFLTLPQQLREFGAPAARFIFPNAPERELTVRPGYKTRAWYDLLSNDFGSQNEDRQGLAKMHQRISQIINEIVTSGLRAERIFLGGFSMGAAMSLYSSVRQVRTLAGCIALSGYFPAADLIEKDITPAGRGTPVFMAHGAFDSVIPSVLAEHGADLLENTLDTLIWREYNIDHEICPDELMNVARFMSTALQR